MLSKWASRFDSGGLGLLIESKTMPITRTIVRFVDFTFSRSNEVTYVPLPMIVEVIEEIEEEEAGRLVQLASTLP